MLLHKLFKKGSASGLAGRPRSLHADARKVCSLVPHCTATKAHFAGRANLLSAEEYLQEARDMRLGSPRAAELSPVTSESSGVKLQYVNLVMEGGGMLGIATTGFLSVLEEAGVRFLGVGGTSAGAINAVLTVAARDEVTSTAGATTGKILKSCNFAAFEDNDDPYFVEMRHKLAGLLAGNDAPGNKNNNLACSAARMLLDAALFHRKQLAQVWKGMGIHPGKAFTEWLTQQLEELDADTQAKLLAKMKIPAGLHLHYRDSAGTISDVTDTIRRHMECRDACSTVGCDLKSYPLKLVAAEVSSQTKVVFPQEAQLFYQDPSNVHPTEFVRASMSIPLFFQPHKIEAVPGAGSQSIDWAHCYGYTGDVPSTAVFCDGGTLSNFPMSLFAGLSLAGVLVPTIGVQTGPDRTGWANITSPVALLHAMNNSSRHLQDREFLVQNPMYRPYIQFIDTTGFSWLDFDMSQEQREQLLLRGMAAGVKLLKSWQSPLRSLDCSDPTQLPTVRLVMATATAPVGEQLFAVPMQSGSELSINEALTREVLHADLTGCDVDRGMQLVAEALSQQQHQQQANEAAGSQGPAKMTFDLSAAADLADARRYAASIMLLKKEVGPGTLALLGGRLPVYQTMQQLLSRSSLTQGM